jgi:two-component system alkaline phosphatase synthesis response regulator PhoP
MIYLVEDDDNIRELIIYTLNNGGYESKGFSRPSEFWSEMKNSKPQMILLDIMLPEEDGLTILKRLRKDRDTKDIPIMMLTAKGSEYDKVIGLDYGADDYMPKPFGMMEFMARVKALLRRTENRADDEKDIVIDNLTISTTKHQVMVLGREVFLTLKEFELLILLAKNQGLVFSRDSILSKIWGYSFDGESRTVDVHIRSLRIKLKEAGDLIETVRGVGYKISDKK